MPGLPDSDLPPPYFCTQMAVAVILHRKFDLCCQVPLPKWNSRNVSVNTDIYLPLPQLVPCFIPLFLGCVTLEYLLSLSQKTLWFFSSQWEKKKGWSSFNRDSSKNFTCPIFPIKYSDKQYFYIIGTMSSPHLEMSDFDSHTSIADIQGHPNLGLF